MQHRESRRIENWVDGSVQDSLYREMAAIFHRDQPMTFVLPEIRFAVAHERIRGLRSPDRYEPTLGVLYGWIDEEP